MFKTKTWTLEQNIRRFFKKSSGLSHNEICSVLTHFGFTVEVVQAYLPYDYAEYSWNCKTVEEAQAFRKELLAQVTADLTYAPGVEKIITKVGPMKNHGFEYHVAKAGDAFLVIAPNDKTFTWNFRGTAKYQKAFWSWLETETAVFAQIETIEAPKVSTTVEGIEVDRSKTAHSDKGLETLRLMGTAPEQWDFTPIKWEPRTVLMPKEVYCQDCKGNGVVYFKDDFRVSDSWKARIEKCPSCPTDKKRYTRGSGKVTEWELQEVLVGVPDWLPGTVFDSRFDNCDCQLCAKSIYASGLVAVHGKDANGTVHGMYVGEDCARKFWGFKKFTDDGRTMEVNLPKKGV